MGKPEIYTILDEIKGVMDAHIETIDIPTMRVVGELRSLHIRAIDAQRRRILIERD